MLSFNIREKYAHITSRIDTQHWVYSDEMQDQLEEFSVRVVIRRKKTHLLGNHCFFPIGYSSKYADSFPLGTPK